MKYGSLAAMAALAMAGIAPIGGGGGAGSAVPGAIVNAPSNAPADTTKNTLGDRSKALNNAFMRLMQRRGAGGGYKPSYPNGPGWTQAQVQRMARKKRNQAKNRRNHR